VNELALLPTPQEWNQIIQMGGDLVRSGMLPTSIKTAEAAAAIMLTGRELGIPPMRAFSKISVISGKPAMGAELMLSRVLERYPDTDWVPVRRDAEGAVVKGRRKASDPYTEFSFLLEDAKRAGVMGKDSWQKYPRNMYYWRAVSDMVRALWPECLGPASHTPEELGAEVDEDGEVVETTARQLEPPPPAPKEVAKTAPKGPVYDHANVKNQTWLADALKVKWPSGNPDLYTPISQKLHGRPFLELKQAVDEVEAELTNQEIPF